MQQLQLMVCAEGQPSQVQDTGQLWMALSRLSRTVQVAIRQWLSAYELLMQEVQAVPVGNCRLRTLYTSTTNTEHINLWFTGIGENLPQCVTINIPDSENPVPILVTRTSGGESVSCYCESDHLLKQLSTCEAKHQPTRKQMLVNVNLHSEWYQVKWSTVGKCAGYYTHPWSIHRNIIR